jgi:hypothetical protein
VGGLAHYFEQEGIPTTLISLVRLHAETMRPPRALSVTFDFGRPLGTPGDPAAQRRVMLEALRLLERTDVPVLVDFVDDQGPAQTQTEDSLDGLACALPLRTEIRDLKETVRREMAGLRSLYETVAARSGGLPVGLLGLPIEVVAEFVLSFLDPVPADNPRPEMLLPHVLKLAVDDLVAFYNVATSARPGVTANAQRVSRWFWHEAAMGKAIQSVRSRLLMSEDPMVKAVAYLMVAWAQAEQPIELPKFAESYQSLIPATPSTGGDN